MKNKKNNLQFLSAGCDIASEKIDVFLMNQEEKGKHRIFNNNEAGIEEMIKWFKENNFQGNIVMESTGSYHELLAVKLYSNEYNVFTVNPLRPKKYAKAGIQNNKTDKIDARILAEMGIKEKFSSVDKFDLTSSDVHIRKKFSLVKSLEKKMQQLNAMIKNYEKFQNNIGHELSEPEKQIKELIKSIGKNKRKLEQEITKLAFPKKDKKAQKAKEILTSIIGISPYYASLIHTFYSFDKSKDVYSWVAYAGMAISVIESGKKKGKGKISKRGHGYLSKRSYSSGWGATMHNETYRKLYDFLKNSGRTHKEALVIVGKRILHTAYYCLKYNRKYNTEIAESNIERYIKQKYDTVKI